MVNTRRSFKFIPPTPVASQKQLSWAAQRWMALLAGVKPSEFEESNPYPAPNTPAEELCDILTEVFKQLSLTDPPGAHKIDDNTWKTKHVTAFFQASPIKANKRSDYIEARITRNVDGATLFAYLGPARGTEHPYHLATQMLKDSTYWPKQASFDCRIDTYLALCGVIGIQSKNWAAGEPRPVGHGANMWEQTPIVEMILDSAKYGIEKLDPHSRNKWVRMAVEEEFKRQRGD